MHYPGKRGIDFVCTLVGLLLLTPLLGATALLVRIAIGTPILFRQQRPGLNGKPFNILKFRTMTDATDANGELLPDEERLTPVGRFLRRTSLDEFPELVNVLRGDMSLVGPRPLLTEYLPYYTEREQLRHSVRPGITGLAQISGRNNLSWDERLELDVWYVEHCSLLLDLRILLTTLLSVLSAKNVVSDPRSVMLDLDEERGTKIK